MADTTDFRNGFTLEWNNGVWQIVDFLHVKPGKGGAFVRTKLKNVRDGKVLDNTFRAGEKVEEVRVERRPHQYLYEDDYGLHFMNTDTYEQFSLPPEQVEAILAHELAHAIAHDPEEGEELSHEARELQAEGAAYLACYALGLDTSKASLPYLKHYERDGEAVEAHLKVIDRIAWRIVDAAA